MQIRSLSCEASSKCFEQKLSGRFELTKKDELREKVLVTDHVSKQGLTVADSVQQSGTGSVCISANAS